jgi:hypothetical protein
MRDFLFLTGGCSELGEDVADRRDEDSGDDRLSKSEEAAGFEA